jgi:hypothetical protein
MAVDGKFYRGVLGLGFGERRRRLYGRLARSCAGCRLGNCSFPDLMYFIPEFRFQERGRVFLIARMRVRQYRRTVVFSDVHGV